MHRQHSIDPYQSQPQRQDEERPSTGTHGDRDRFEPRRDVRPHDDGPQFGPARPDLDRGMRGGPAVGEAGAYGPRSDMMEYGGFEPGAYGRDDATDLPALRADYNMYSRDEDRRDDARPRDERRHRISLFGRIHRR